MSIESLMRVAGRDEALSSLVARAQLWPLPITLASPASSEDYALLDLSLRTEPGAPAVDDNAPVVGLGYAGFTPRQRGQFLAWQQTPLTPAPPAFQQLLLANLEVRLLQDTPLALAARTQLEMLEQSDAWRDNPALWRVSLLSHWLAQDGGALATWLAHAALPADLFGLALGMQALLDAPLSAAEVRPIARQWRQPAAELSEAVLVFRLQSLAVALGQAPLQWVLAQLGPDAPRPRPWRCQHRDLRVELPQPDVRRALEPLLAELAILGDATVNDATVGDATEAMEVAAPAPSDGADAGHSALSRAHLIVEFRQSRSEFFAIALRQAQKRAGFMQLLDEDRHLVYRVVFRKNEMNHFWQLWNYVQGWTATRVYCKGEELQKWQVYPYSQYLR